MKLKRNPKLIYFDVGHVLVKKITTYEQDAAKELGISHEEFEKLHMDIIDTQITELTEQFNNMRTMDDMRNYFHMFHDEVARRLGTKLTDEQKERLLEHRYGNYELKEGVIEALDELYKHYQLGIISNAFPSRRYIELERLGLNKYFNPVIVSFEVGVHKPDKEIFELGIKEARVAPADILFVDDKIDNLEAAKSVGIDNVVLVVHKKDSDEYPKVHTLPELVNLLKEASV